MKHHFLAKSSTLTKAHVLINIDLFSMLFTCIKTNYYTNIFHFSNIISFLIFVSVSECFQTSGSVIEKLLPSGALILSKSIINIFFLPFLYHLWIDFDGIVFQYYKYVFVSIKRFVMLAFFAPSKIGPVSNKKKTERLNTFKTNVYWSHIKKYFEMLKLKKVKSNLWPIK